LSFNTYEFDFVLLKSSAVACYNNWLTKIHDRAYIIWLILKLSK